jgi:hypothetical protein
VLGAIPLTLSAIGIRHKTIEQDGWRLLTPRHAPTATLEGHLTFALKYEGLDLAVLKRLFVEVGPAKIEALVRVKPTGNYARRIWFLCEWLTGKKLGLRDATTGNYVDAVDVKQQFAVAGENSSRHRVRNNLPGTRENMVEMPDRTLDLLFRMLRQNGRLSKRAARRSLRNSPPLRPSKSNRPSRILSLSGAHEDGPRTPLLRA